MKAVVKEDVKCAPEGHTVLSFKKGEEVEGALAEYLVDKKFAKEKGKKKPGPKNKSTPEPEVATEIKPDHEG